MRHFFIVTLYNVMLEELLMLAKIMRKTPLFLLYTLLNTMIAKLALLACIIAVCTFGTEASKSIRNKDIITESV